MNKGIGVVLGVAAMLLFFSSIFTVQEYEKAIVLKFGEIIGVDYAPGLHFKWPLVNTVKKYDARVQTLDADPELFLTSEKKNLVVDSFVMWRVKDLRTFYTAVLGNKEIVESRLDQIVKDRMRSEFSKRKIHEVVSEHRDELMGVLIEGLTQGSEISNMDVEQSGSEEASKQMNVEARLGIEIVDIRLKRVDFPRQINQSVFARMSAERQRIAKELRAQGAEEAEKIRAKADRERVVLIAKAYQKAEEIRGEGDAVAADTYAQTYGQNHEFYALYRSLNAYKKAFSQKSDMLVIQPNTEFFRYFKNKEAQ